MRKHCTCLRQRTVWTFSLTISVQHRNLHSLLPPASQEKPNTRESETARRRTLQRFTISIEVCSICQDDLVFLPRYVARKFQGITSRLYVCTRVTRNLQLTDPFSSRVLEVTGDAYWRTPFEPLLTPDAATEFTVLDTVGRKGRSPPAEVEVARAGNLERRSTVLTHLGSRLQSGDTCLAYDLSTLNLAGPVAEEVDEVLSTIPYDVVLLRRLSRHTEPAEPSRRKKPKQPAHKDA